MKETIKEKCYWLKHAAFHPFDGFYEIRFRNKGSLFLAIFFLALFGIMMCVDYQYTGFIMNKNYVSGMNSLSVFSRWVLGFVLFAISNWSVTTLLNGKGNLINIMIVIGYSLVPIILATVVKVLLSNYVIEEEAMIVNMILGIGIVWFLFMILSGLCVIHEYSFGKNLGAIFLTFVAAAIILFLGILFFTLIEKMIIFIVSVAQEITRRI